MRTKWKAGRSVGAVGVWWVVTTVAWAAEVQSLRCEYRTDPLGVDTCAPRLSWIIASDRRGEVQTAYQVLVASTPELLAQNQGDLWDSGRVASDRQNQVEYAGEPLAARMKCHWKVRVWDREGKESAWSPPAQWTMGLLKPDDWQGVWIGAQKKPAGSGTDELGFAVEARSANEAHWVQVDLGSTVPIDRVVLHPQTHNDPAAGGWINGYGFPLRFRVEVADGPDFKTPTVLANKTEADFPNPGRTAVVFAADGRRGSGRSVPSAGRGFANRIPISVSSQGRGTRSRSSTGRPGAWSRNGNRRPASWNASAPCH